jgi:hypothetical protein
LDLRELGVAADAWRARVDGAVAGDEEMGEYVRGLEAQLGESLGTGADAPASEEDIPSGDDLAQAFEDYLREQGNEA